MTPEVAQVIRARLALARVTGGKTQAVLQRVCPDGRLRGLLAYYGAHTGRWSGRGFQPQNLPRPIQGLDYAEMHRQLEGATVEGATIYLERRCAESGCSLGALLSSLLRGVIVSATGRLAAVDYSSVEARVLLWLAGDEQGLAVYRRFDAAGGPDPYMHAAAAVFRVRPADVTRAQRAVGKVVVLACGFGGSVGAFAAMAETYAVDVSALDVREIVDAWRDSRPLVAGSRKGGFANEDGEWIVTRQGGMWKDVERSVRLALAAPAGGFSAGRCTWSMQRGPHLVCTLPSGRPIVYRDCRIEDVERFGAPRPTITYFGKVQNRSAWGRVATYGGKLAENITQAVARDLMADALLQLEELPGIETVLTIHDEILCEVDHDARLEDIRAAMLGAPQWASGLPLAAEGRVGVRYGKA